MMVTVRDRVAKLKKAGRTLKEAQDANVTDDLDPKWGTGITNGQRFTELVYRSS